MKLRLRENSIRLRLLQSEIKQLKDNGLVTEQIQFTTSQSLIYKVQISENINELSAKFQTDEITIEIPYEEAKIWIDTNQVGLQNEQRIDSEKTLTILIEKDFICLDRPMDVDNLDAFPNPKITC